ncbi:MAG TPA: hypothetical protein VFD03_04125 [Clostridia bacterium]|nr:hypothetical protein [Clostridia bacterium]
MNNYLDEYYNDEDIIAEPIPLREVHAIRLMLNDENKNLSYNARSKKVKDTVQPIIEEYGFKVADRAD